MPSALEIEIVKALVTTKVSTDTGPKWPLSQIVRLSGVRTIRGRTLDTDPNGTSLMQSVHRLLISRGLMDDPQHVMRSRDADSLPDFLLSKTTIVLALSVLEAAPVARHAGSVRTALDLIDTPFLTTAQQPPRDEIQTSDGSTTASPIATPPVQLPRPLLAPAPVPPVKPPVCGAPQPAPTPSGPSIAPAVRKTAEKYGIDLRAVTGTGKGGKVLQRDVDMAILRELEARQRAAGAGVPLLSVRGSLDGVNAIETLTHKGGVLLRAQPFARAIGYGNPRMLESDLRSIGCEEELSKLRYVRPTDLSQSHRGLWINREAVLGSLRVKRVLGNPERERLVHLAIETVWPDSELLDGLRGKVTSGDPSERDTPMKSNSDHALGAQADNAGDNGPGPRRDDVDAHSDRSHRGLRFERLVAAIENRAAERALRSLIAALGQDQEVLNRALSVLDQGTPVHGLAAAFEENLDG